MFLNKLVLLCFLIRTRSLAARTSHNRKSGKLFMSMSMCRWGPCVHVYVSMSMSPCSYVHFHVSMLICLFPYVYFQVSISMFPFPCVRFHVSMSICPCQCFHGGILYTSTAPLPMRYTTMGYTSMRYTSTALYFYKKFTQAPNKIFLKHFKQKICK